MPLYDRPQAPVARAANSATQSALNTQASIAPELPAQLSVVSATETVVPSPNNATVPLQATLNPNTANEQNVLTLAASGYIKTLNTTNVTVKVYSGTSLTVGSDTLLGSSGAIAVNTATCPWMLLAHLVYDSVSGKLQGSIKFWLNNTFVAEVAISNTLTGISNLTALAVASFVLSFTSSAAAGGSASLLNVQHFSVG
jgi:hypothetical protein